MLSKTRIHTLTRLLCGPPLVVIVAFSVVGCYTILKHPVTSQEGPERQEYTEEHSQEYYRQNCLDCHEDYSSYPYGYFYGEYPEYYFEYPRWGYYYAYPWWWDNHWYGGDEYDGSFEIEGQSGGRSGRHSALAPPYVHGAPAINTGGSRGPGYRSRNAPVSGGEGGRTSGQSPSGRSPAALDGAKTKTRITTAGKKENGEDGEQKDSKKKQKANRRRVAPPR